MKISFIILADDGGGGPQSTKDIIFSLELHNIQSELYTFRKNKGFSGLLKDIYDLFFYFPISVTWYLEPLLLHLLMKQNCGQKHKA